MEPDTGDEAWLAALNDRHLANLTQSEVTRALRALSSCYVERRDKLASGGALDGAGKRAAFALFYGPQHFVLTRAIVSSLKIGATRVTDLGCGTGSAGAAAAIACGDVPVDGFDLSPWAVAEANWTYRVLGLRGRATQVNLRKLKVRSEAGGLVLASYAVNELPDEARAPLLAQLMDAHAKGASVLVIEPIARRVNLWWRGWAESVLGAGGRADDWRFRDLLPARQRLLAKGAGLDVQEMTARTLYLEGRRARWTAGDPE
ncbi:MAG: methyltransferase domain-containing protein [Acidobacteriota bacterium]|nr:methyltransferase domain-containing protein [Acidobacteriota bacterium]